MNLSDDIVIVSSQDLSDEALHSDNIKHEAEDISLRTFEDQGVSIIKPVVHPCIEVHDQTSQDIMTKSGVEIVACYVEDIDMK